MKRKLRTAGVAVTLMGMAAVSAAAEEPVKASDAIESVKTIAFMDVDGPKVKAIVVEYDQEVTAGAIDTETYDVYSYVNLPQVFDIARDNGGPKEGDEALQPYSALPGFEYQEGEPGSVVKVYVSAEPAIDPAGIGDENGKYVILELNTAYQLSAVSADWRACVAGGVAQLKDVETAEGGVVEAEPETAIGNYSDGYSWDINPRGSNHSVTLQKVFDDTSYVLEGLEGYALYTDNTEKEHEEHHDAISDEDRTVDYIVSDATVLSKVAGGAFQASDCFSEKDAEQHDVSLMYSLFVPDDYEEQVKAGKSFGLVLHIEDAGALGDDPMLSLTECQAAANYASAEVQQMAKDKGLGGLIVVIPQITRRGQSMSDNLTGNEYVPAVWQLLDMLTETYEVDMDRIFASGQSMGGMQVLDMAAQRDNYFAGIWAIGSQWGNNYNKEEEYRENSYTAYPTDGKMVTNEDWENWYYSISDDNILATNMSGDATATDFWQLTNDLFTEFSGVTIPYTQWDPTVKTKDEQNDALRELLAQDNTIGIFWNALSNGNHKSTWIYAHKLNAAYEWLLNQTRTSEEERGKLEELSGAYADHAGTYLFNTLSVVNVSMD